MTAENGTQKGITRENVTKCIYLLKIVLTLISFGVLWEYRATTSGDTLIAATTLYLTSIFADVLLIWIEMRYKTNDNKIIKRIRILSGINSVLVLIPLVASCLVFARVWYIYSCADSNISIVKIGSRFFDNYLTFDSGIYAFIAITIALLSSFMCCYKSIKNDRIIGSTCVKNENF